MRSSLDEVRNLTRTLLVARGYYWDVDFDDHPHRSGCADFRRKTIFYSARLIFERTHAGSIDTVYHEVAHVIAGEAHGHDEIWAKIARKLGGSGSELWDPTTRLTSVARVA